MISTLKMVCGYPRLMPVPTKASEALLLTGMMQHLEFQRFFSQRKVTANLQMLHVNIGSLSFSKVFMFILAGISPKVDWLANINESSGGGSTGSDVRRNFETSISIIQENANAKSQKIVR